MRTPGYSLRMTVVTLALVCALVLGVPADAAELESVSLVGSPRTRQS